MATYATDLTVLTACDAVTGWTELPSPHAAGAGPAADTENYFHNSASVSQATGQATGQGAGIQFDNGAALTWTTTSNWVILYWSYYAAPTNLTSWSTGGMRLGIGSADNNAKMYNAMGVDFAKYPYGGWQCTAIDPEFATADQTIGTVGTGYQNFAVLPNINAKITKGSPLAVDVLRYGRGELQVTGTAATFLGMATANDNATTARWGLFQAFGNGYEWKGLMSLGLTATSTTFSDSNVSISIQDTPRVLTGFNKIEINHASSSVTWNTVNITGVQTSITGAAPVSAGDFEVVDNATVSLTGCTFTDMGTFLFNDGTNPNDVIDCIFRRCGLITQGGATFTGGLITNADNAIAMSVDDLSVVTGVTFKGDETTTPGHAVDLGTYATTGTLNWGNSLNNGVTNQSEWEGTTQTATAGPQGDANAAIKVNVTAGNALKISVGSGATIPTVYNTGTGTLEITANEVTLTITVKDINTGSVIEGAMVYVTNVAETATYINKVETNASGQVTDTRSLGSAQPLSGVVRAATPATKAYTKYYKSAPVAGTYSNTADTSLTIQMIPDE